MKRIACLGLSVCLLFMAGCQEAGPKPPAVAKVSGTVTLDGKPMEGGEVRFGLAGQPPKIIAIKAGAFAGDAFVGPNEVGVVWEKDGPPHPMDPTKFITINTVDAKFSGPNTPFKPNIAPSGASDLKFEVTSAH